VGRKSFDSVTSSDPDLSRGDLLVEVRVEAGRRSGFEIVLCGERKVRVPAGFNATDLGRLLAVLDPSC